MLLIHYIFSCLSVFFFFNDTATTEIYTLSLHDALPILASARSSQMVSPTVGAVGVTHHPPPCPAARPHDATTPSKTSRAVIASAGGRARRRRGAAARRTAHWSGAPPGPHRPERACGCVPGAGARPRRQRACASPRGSYRGGPAGRSRRPPCRPSPRRGARARVG